MRSGAGYGLKSSGFNTRHRADFVIVGRITGNANSADDLTRALPGERVLFRYSRVSSQHDEGVVSQVLEQSQDRVEPECERFGLCGGCSLQHMDPAAQIRAKQAVLLDNLDSLTFRFLQLNDEWVDQWPPIDAAAASNSHVLPRAVEITLILPDEGELTRVVEMLQ